MIEYTENFKEYAPRLFRKVVAMFLQMSHLRFAEQIYASFKQAFTGVNLDWKNTTVHAQNEMKIQKTVTQPMKDPHINAIRLHEAPTVKQFRDVSSPPLLAFALDI